MTIDIAIIGDNFMTSAAFEKALRAEVSQPLKFLTLDLPFPDLPVTQKSNDPEYSQLKEFQGTTEQVLSVSANAVGLITHLAPVTASLLEKLPELKFVGVARGGPVNVDRVALNSRGIRLVNTPGRNASAVAEFTIGALISESRNISRGHADLMKGVWRGDLYRADVQRKELSRMTVGIVGYSHIGKRVARLLEAFGSKILVADPFVDLTADEIARGICKVSIDELYSSSDAVTLHLPVTPETHEMINEESLAKMKPGAILVNTSRGSLIDEKALCAALDSGQLSGAALETFVVEPLPVDSPLLGRSDVTLTPHIAGASNTTIADAASMIATDFNRFLNNEPAVNAV